MAGYENLGYLGGREEDGPADLDVDLVKLIVRKHYGAKKTMHLFLEESIPFFLDH